MMPHKGLAANKFQFCTFGIYSFLNIHQNELAHHFLILLNLCAIA